MNPARVSRDFLFGIKLYLGNRGRIPNSKCDSSQSLCVCRSSESDQGFDRASSAFDEGDKNAHTAGMFSCCLCGNWRRVRAADSTLLKWNSMGWRMSFFIGTADPKKHSRIIVESILKNMRIYCWHKSVRWTKLSRTLPSSTMRRHMYYYPCCLTERRKKLCRNVELMYS